MRTLTLTLFVLLSTFVSAQELTREEAQHRAVAEHLGLLPDEAELSIEVEVSPKVARIGEPVIAHIVIRNSGKVSEKGVWAPWKGFPNSTLDVKIIGPDSMPVSDRLYRFKSFLRSGGLGPYRWKQAGPNAWEEHDLLNTWGAIDAPGMYKATVTVDAYFGNNKQKLTAQPVAFSVVDQKSTMTEAQAANQFNVLPGVHPCLIYGLQDQNGKTPYLLDLMMENERGGNNSHLFSLMALSMMSDTETVLRELVKRLPDARAKSWMLFHALTDENDGELLDRLMDNPNRAISDSAYAAALTLGTEKAIERLPAELQKLDSSIDPAGAAGLFLQQTSNSPEFTDRHNRVNETLLARVKQSPDAEHQAMIVLQFAHSDKWQEAAQLAFENPEPEYHKMAWALLYTGNAGYPNWPALTPDKAHRTYFVEKALQELKSRGEEASKATWLLGCWHHEEALPALRQALHADDQNLRTNAAFALYVMSIKKNDPDYVPVLNELTDVLLDKQAPARNLFRSFGIDVYESHLENSMALMKTPPEDQEQWMRETVRLLLETAQEKTQDP